jgi:hypothetical protein
MGGYLPHISSYLFVVYALVVRYNTTGSELHAMDAIVPPTRSFGSWTWRHWSLRRCQCDESSAMCEVATQVCLANEKASERFGCLCDIFLQEDLNFATINLQKYSKERDKESVTIQLKLNGNTVIILSIYRAPVGDYDYFLNKLDYILNFLHSHNTEFILCGDININYLECNNRKVNLVEMLNTYNIKKILYISLVGTFSKNWK